MVLFCNHFITFFFVHTIFFSKSVIGFFWSSSVAKQKESWAVWVCVFFSDIDTVHYIFGSQINSIWNEHSYIALFLHWSQHELFLLYYVCFSKFSHFCQFVELLDTIQLCDYYYFFLSFLIRFMFLCTYIFSLEFVCLFFGLVRFVCLRLFSLLLYKLIG